MESLSLLYVVATPMEAQAIFTDWKIEFQVGFYQNDHMSLLITGFGALNTALSLENLLSRKEVRRMIQVGIAGVYLEAQKQYQLALGSLVHVYSEAWGDLGAEDGASFLNFDKQVIEENWPGEYPFAFQPLPRVRSLTVNTCTGSERTAHRRYLMGAEVENMEGLAFFKVARQKAIPALQVRGISNLASTRKKELWKTDEALASLRKFVNEL